MLDNARSSLPEFVRLDKIREKPDFLGVIRSEKKRRDVIGQTAEVQRAAPLGQSR